MLEAIMKNIECVIFDMDGLILDTERLSFEAWQKILKKYGQVMTREIYTTLMGITYENVVNRLIEIYGRELPMAEIYAEKNREVLKFMHDNGVPVKPGIYELLDFLVERNYKLALATSTSREKAVNLLERVGIKDKFGVMVFGDEVVNSKPDPEIFLKAAEKLGVNPEKCIVLEDSSAGIEAAYRAGMKGINIPDLKMPDEKIRKYSHKIFSRLLDVRDYLKESVAR
jgi:beta-phosphoglucomutase family hydrolase